MIRKVPGENFSTAIPRPKPERMPLLHHDTYPVGLPELTHRLSDAIMLLSWDNRLVFVNDAAGSFLRPGINAIGRPIDEVLEHQLYEAIASTLIDAGKGKDVQHIDFEKKDSASPGIRLQISV